MAASPASPSPAGRLVLSDGLIAALILAGAALMAYHNSFHGPFEFDDLPALTQNETIRSLWPPGRVLHPPLDLTVSGRPVLNLSFALNYAFGGLEVFGYHAANLVIHLLAGLVLFGIVRRTPFAGAGRIGPAEIALAASLLWVLHPLQTEAVTYIVQRAESLMGLLYFLTLYCFIRGAVPVAGAEPASKGRAAAWLGLCWLCCLLGMGTKEVMVSAPVILLLYDRAFVAGDLAEAWRRRRGLYLALAATWIPLFFLVLSTQNRNGTAGIGVGVGFGQYWLTQAPAVVHYLKLAAWPTHQIFDYGAQWVSFSPALARDIALVAGLAAATLWGLKRNSAWGFLGFWFFAILAPTSLVPGNRQTLAEHRMYLALAPLCVGAAWLLAQAVGRRGGALFALACAALAAGLGWKTERRNEVYRSGFALWDQTVADCPSNPYARNNLGNMLMQQGRVAAAIREYELALQLKPDYAEGHNNLGTALVNQGKIGEAEAQFRQVLASTGVGISESYGAEVHNNLGVALFEGGNPQAAVAQFEEALRLKPRYAEGHTNLGNALGRLGRTAEAIDQYRQALAIEPGYAEVHNNLGNVLLDAGHLDEAIAEYRLAVKLRPAYPEAHNNLGNVLLGQGRLPEAVGEFVQALRLKPGFAAARFNLANALEAQGRTGEALRQYAVAIQLRPNYPEAHNNLGNILVREGHLAEGIAQLTTALALRPGLGSAHSNLAIAFLAEHRLAEARLQIDEALRLQPNDPRARNELGRICLAEGRPAEAAAAFSQALALGLRLPEVENNLGEALAAEGRGAEAAGHFRAALKLRPGFAPARSNLAALGLSE